MPVLSWIALAVALAALGIAARAWVRSRAAVAHADTARRAVNRALREASRVAPGRHEAGGDNPCAVTWSELREQLATEADEVADGAVDAATVQFERPDWEWSTCPQPRLADADWASAVGPSRHDHPHRHRSPDWFTDQ